MINIALAALLRIIGLRKGEHYEEALQLIDMTFENLMGLRVGMIKNLDDEHLYSVLTGHNGLDTQRLALLSRLFEEEGYIYEAMGRQGESREDFARALRYRIEVFFQEMPSEDNTLPQEIEELAQKLELPTLKADTLWPLCGYQEERGNFAEAEKILLLLAERPEIRTEIQPEVVAFYERMKGKSPAELEKGGLSPLQVQDRYFAWKQ